MDLVEGSLVPGAEELAALLHDIKGMAGTLGADEMYGLALEAEALAQAHRMAGIRLVVAHMQVIAEEWERSLGVFGQADPVDVSADAAPLSQETLAQILNLRHLLAARDLDALELFNTLGKALSATLGPDRFAEMRRHMANLDFSNASELLDLLELSSG